MKLEAILRAGVRSFIDLTEMNDPLEPCEVPPRAPAQVRQAFAVRPAA